MQRSDITVTVKMAKPQVHNSGWFQWKKISHGCHARNRDDWDDAAQLMSDAYEFFTKPARENMLSTGTEDALNVTFTA